MHSKALRMFRTVLIANPDQRGDRIAESDN